MFKGLEPSMHKLQELKLFSHEEQFLHYGFSGKKYAKLKHLMVIPLLKLVVCFSITDNIVSAVKLFADDTSTFSAVNDANISADELKKDLQKTPEWIYRWKMSFNPDLRSDFF